LTVVRALAALLACLGLQAGVAQLSSQANQWIDLMMVPVVWYAIRRSQRAGMLVGCTAGLMEDAWTSAGTLGLGGFRKTLVGWMLGGAASRVDLNHGGGRFLAGALCTLADGLLEWGFRAALPLEPTARPWWMFAARSLLTATVIVAAFSVTDRVLGHEPARGRLT